MENKKGRYKGNALAKKKTIDAAYIKLWPRRRQKANKKTHLPSAGDPRRHPAADPRRHRAADPRRPPDAGSASPHPGPAVAAAKK